MLDGSDGTPRGFAVAVKRVDVLEEYDLPLSGGRSADVDEEVVTEVPITSQAILTVVCAIGVGRIHEDAIRVVVDHDLVSPATALVTPEAAAPSTNFVCIIASTTVRRGVETDRIAGAIV